MRNLKRALSLTLASVMLLGMMVVGSSAAAGYDDVAETDNVEAIEVLQSIEVMVGDERGFGPERPVNRAEMAVVMAKLLSLDYDYYVSTCPFDDVYDWAQGYVGACYANKIVSGRGEGVYDPGATVTAVEAASMLMRALGYFQYQNDYADGFVLSTVTQGTKIGIFDGVGSSAEAPMTRNQVAQMVLNALQSSVVEPDGNTINLTTPDGTVLTGKVNYVSVTSDKAFARAIGRTQATSVGSTNDGYIVELGERLYNGKLKLEDDALDPFGRPARKWENDGKAIGTYAKKELMVFDHVGKVVGTDLYNLLGATTLKDYDLRVAVDGIADLDVYNSITNSVRDNANSGVVFKAADLNRNNKAKIGATGTGVLTQVFVDHETDDIYVAIINTYLAIADKAYDEKKEEASVEVFDIDKELTADEYAKTAMRPGTEQSEKFKLGNEDFTLVKDIAKDDAYLVTVAEGKIQTITPAEVLSGVSITSFKRNDFVVSDGTTYNYTTTAGYRYKDMEAYTDESLSGTVENLKDRTYNIYLDAYGNLIGLKELDAPKNYVFITSIDRNGSYIANKTATANAVFLDGTSEVIDINMIKSEWRANRFDGSSATKEFVNEDGTDAGTSLLNTWCTYTKNGDVYTVREVYSVIDPTTGPVNGITTATVDNGTGLTAMKPDGAGTNGTDLAQFHDVERSVSVKEITLKNGLRLNGGYATGSYSNIYGDSDSVYLTADLGTVKAADGQTYGIIKGAESVYTGIDGTSITIWNAAKAITEANSDNKRNTSPIASTAYDDVSYGVYTLYDGEGIIIASMIVGEGSSAKDLVYVTSSDAKLESDNGGSTKAANDGLWTWTREVVRDGEKVDLIEVGDTIDALSRVNMKQHHWYEIKTNANGEVTEATPAYVALDGYVANNDDRSVFVGEYENINDAVENEATDVVLYHQDNGSHEEPNASGYSYTHAGFGSNQPLEIQGKNILAVTNKQGSGIYFRNDVHVILEYWNRNVDGIDVKVGEGVDDLKDMVDFVNENNIAAIARDGGRKTGSGGTTYYVSALIENGAATTIVIYDRYNNYTLPTGTVDTYTLTLKGNLIDAVKPATVKYILDGKTVAAEDLVYGWDATTGAPAYVEYKIPAVATGVVIFDEDITATFDGYLPYDNNTGTVRVVATPSSKTINFKLEGNLTLTNAPTAADRLYAVTFGNGVQVDPNSFRDDQGKKVTSQRVAGNAYYFKDSDNLMYMDVTTTNTNNAIAVSDVNTKAMLKMDGNLVSAGPGVKDTMKLKNVLAGNMWIYEAVRYKTNANLDGAKIDGVTFDSTVNLYVKYNETVTIDLTGTTAAVSGTKPTAVIFDGDQATYGDNVANGLKAVNDNKLTAAYKLTLNNVGAKLHQNSSDTTTSGAGPEMFQNVSYVKSGTAIYPLEAHVLDAAGAEIAANVTMNKDITWNGLTKVTIEAGKTAVEVVYPDSNGVNIRVSGDTGAVSIYVAEGTEIEVSSGVNTLKVNGKTSADSGILAGVAFGSSGKSAKITVGTTDISLDY